LVSDRVALFAHEGFGVTFLSCVLGIPLPLFNTSFDMQHSGMSVIKFPEVIGEPVYPRMLQLSNDSHIYDASLPLNYNNSIRF